MRFGGDGADEPSLGLALTRSGYRAPDDDGRGMRTPSALTGRPRLNIANGPAHFIKWGVTVNPCIVHFAGGRWHRPLYRQQVLTLRLIGRGAPRFVAAATAWLVFGSGPAVQRLARRLVRRRVDDEIAPWS
jgi:hypothetical protein